MIAHNTDNTLMTLRYKLPDVSMLAAESAFEAGGHKYPAGSFLIQSADKARL